MPAGRINQSLYIGPNGSIELLNASTLYKPGELGSQIQTPGNKAYQLVQLDSGVTASTNAGVALAGHVAFWKNRSAYLVTNDKVQAETGNCSSACGVFVASTAGGAAGSAGPTAGNFCVIQQRGTHIGVLTNGTAAANNDVLCAAAVATTGTAAVVKFSTGTAPTTFPPIGIATAATGAVTANYTPCRLGGWDIVDQP